MKRPSIIYIPPRYGAHKKKTEAEFVERTGDKTRIIKHSHNYTTTGQRHRTLDHRHSDLDYGRGHLKRLREIDEQTTDISSSEDELIADIPISFSFSLPPYGQEADKTTVPEGLRVTSQSQLKTRTEESMQAARKWAYTENIYNITHSCYARGSPASDSAIADFVMEKALRDTEKMSVPLLRWIHLESQFPSFISFLEYASHSDELNENERLDTTTILERVRETHERPILTPNGTNGKYMEPNLVEEVVYDNKYKKKKRESRALLLCLPYFSLGPYSAQAASFLPMQDLHPLRTLLQSSFGLTPRKRDMQQAVCGLNHAAEGHCYHVPQIWCIVLNDNLLITCARISASDIQHDLINLVLLPSPPQGKKHFHLRVSDGGSRVWLIPVKGYLTWFEFIANFLDITDNFSDDYKIWHDGKVCNGDNWRAVIYEAQRAPAELRLRRTIYRRDKQSNLSSSATEDQDATPGISTHGRIADEGLELHEDTPAKESSLEDVGASISAPAAKRHEGISQVIEGSLRHFHVFLWFLGNPVQPRSTGSNKTKRPNRDIDAGNAEPQESLKTPFAVDKDRLDETFSAMDETLRSQYKHHRTYKKCSSHTLQDVESRMRDISLEGKPGAIGDDESIVSTSDRGALAYGPTADEMDYVKDHRGQLYSRRAPVPLAVRITVLETFVKGAKVLFDFFLPLGYTCSMVAKYWGAIYDLIDDETHIDSLIHVKRMEEFDEVLSLAKMVSYELSHGRGPSPWKHRLPNHFGKAWMHLTTCFVLVTTDRYVAGRELRECFQLISEGRRELMRSLIPTSLQDREAVLPLGVLLLIVQKLSADVTGSLPDVSSTYNEFLIKLELEVQADPHSRVHQEKINNLRQEIESILKVLTEQHDCLEALQPSLNRGILRDNSRHREREFYILQETISSLEEKARNFEQMAKTATNLAAFNIHRIESNKDRQEAAILVFTTVTIVFLPLSFVASVFGMNTADIRNMNTPQWLFWACAIPCTVLVMALSMLVIYQFEPARQLWRRYLDHPGTASRPVRGYFEPVAQYAAATNMVGLGDNHEIEAEQAESWIRRT